jgi:hypothetical protein
MALIFQEQIKKQRILIFVFLGLVLITVLILWKGYLFFQGEVPVELIKTHASKIAINLEIFESPLLKELELMPKIPQFEGKIGRENPFIPFSIE